MKMLRMAVLLSFMLVPALALGAPKWVRLSYTGDTARTITISWNDGPAESTVEYGPDSNYGLSASGTSQDFGGDIGVTHEVTLSDLTPDTAYHYRVGGSGDFSGDYVFRTGPEDVCTPVTFGIAADNRGDFSGSSGCWPQVFQALSDAGVAFVVNTGDLVNEGKNDDEWADFLDKSEELMAEIPLMGCIGNHDDDDVEGDGANYNNIFAFARNNENNQEDFYSFDYGNIHFAALSTSSFKGDGFETQRNWLAADLAATDRMWKVVYLHAPIYSSGSHGSNEEGHNPVFIPVFDQYHVDLVVTGHDHIYERYHPMYDGSEVGSYDDGTCYMVSGGGGAATDPIYAFRSKEDGLAAYDNAPKHHYVQISVANNIMHVKAERVPTACLTWGTGGTGVIDEFDIVKTLANDPCQGGTDADNDGVTTPIDCCDAGSEAVLGCEVATADTIYPGAEETCDDGIDQNCDGQDEACPCADADSDGSQDEACGGNDCDDTDPDVNPSATETCGDSIDNDCDDETDEADCENCVDSDEDGYSAIDVNCPSGNDCDDTNNEVSPGATEICNQVDDDCDNETDENDVCTEDCVDSDSDGHYAISASCPAGDDCDDGDSDSYPGATETCGDDIDQDCSGQDLQCGCQDADVDGYSDANCGGQDCDDSKEDVNPGAAESCNGVDDDCDDQTDEDLANLTCGVGACVNSVAACENGQVNTCEPLARPEFPESSCSDQIDNDCDGYVDAADDDCGSSGCGCGQTGSQPAAAGSLLMVMLFGLLFLSRKRS
jgi:calcineurin-like phosphoesterase family protein/purple acid phosphatase-like protein/putative metal-binding protein